MIKTENLTYEYIRRDAEGNPEGATTAVDHLNIHVRPGAFVAVVGRNGSGKSTFARMLNVLLSPAEGAVYVDGMDTRDGKMLLDIRMAAGMVFQNPDNQIIGQVVEEDVDDPNRLSGGQKQRVSIAGVIAMRPKCIIFDEPTAMLDPKGRAEVLRAANRLNREEHITIILITHHMDEVLHADHIFVMDRGQVVMEGNPRAVFSQVERLQELRLTVPQPTLLANALKDAGLPLPDAVLTGEELVTEIASLLP